MTIMKGTSQTIPVTSNPIGARIMVDGKEMGSTPLRIKVKRNKSHSIRAEMPGYNPLEIKITHKFSGTSLALSVSANFILKVDNGNSPQDMGSSIFGPLARLKL